jgi:uncharacterized cofD-like protein
MRKLKIVVIGGGTGTFTVLTGLKKTKAELSAIISMTDSGGSNKVLRDEFGLLPTSDLRQCMVALASKNSNELLRNLFTYRYSRGTGISGMTFGNLFMAALTDIYGSQEEAIKKTCEMLDVQGDIIPVTLEDTNLVAEYENGKQILGEHQIDEPREALAKYKITRLSVFPSARANRRAILAIKSADLIVLGPGDLFTSIISNLVVDGIAVAIKSTKAKIVYVLNLMTRYGQTNGYSGKDHVAELEKYIGKKRLNFVLVNNSYDFPKTALELYASTKAYPVVDDFEGREYFKVIRTDLLGKRVFKKQTSDKLIRSLIRHDSAKLAKEIISIL